MTLADLTREGVLAAVLEFDQLGRKNFLRKYKFIKAKTHFFEIDGRLYDSRAIVGRALGMTAKQFIRGDMGVTNRLKSLGFTCHYFPVHKWKEEEIILACALMDQATWKQIEGEDRRALELSALLQSDCYFPADTHGPDFRSPDAVGRKTADIATSDPKRATGKTNGSRLDWMVREQFRDRPAEMLDRAVQIRDQILGRPAGAPTTLPLPGALAGSTAIIREVPVEAQHVKLFEQKRRAESVQAERREASLVKRYQAWLGAQDRHAIALLIFAGGDGTALRIDLFDTSTQELIEAKGSATREDVRTALGQVLDYAEYVSHATKAVLLPSHPGVDPCKLLLKHGVRCIHETTSGSFVRLDPTA